MKDHRPHASQPPEPQSTGAPSVTPEQVQRQRRYRARLKAFGWHLTGYFLVMIVLVAVNVATTPEDPWFTLPMVGWGGVLALHAAWVMGLFDVFRR